MGRAGEKEMCERMAGKPESDMERLQEGPSLPAALSRVRIPETLTEGVGWGYFLGRVTYRVWGGGGSSMGSTRGEGPTGDMAGAGGRVF